MGDRAFDQIQGSEDVVSDSFCRHVFHEGDMFMGRRMEHDFRAIRRKHRIEFFAFTDADDTWDQSHGFFLLGHQEILMQIIQPVFVDIQQNQDTGFKTADLPGQFTADGTGCAGHHDDFIADEGIECRVVQMNGSASQEVFNVEIVQGIADSAGAHHVFRG